MAYRIVALVKTYDIPEELVINSDQTVLHIRPSTDQTYDVKGVKDVKNLGKDDKRQITCTVSSVASGDLLPLQLIFQGKTIAVIPKDLGAVAARAKGWHLTMSSNHWSNQQTMKEFIDQVIVPWHAKQCEELGRASSSQHYIWNIDYWKVHISEEFRGWLKENHPLLHLVFVLANCTSKLQVVDVVLQRLFKHRFRIQFNLWQSQQIACQVLNGVQPVNIQLQLGIKELRCHLVGWLMGSWEELVGLKQMIRKGWTKCGMGMIHEAEFQAKALSECLTRGLLVLEAAEEDTTAGPEGDIEVFAHMEHASLAGVMEACIKTVWYDLNPKPYFPLYVP